MSPRKKPATVLPIALPLLAVVLDLPAGTEVVGAEIEGGSVLLTLTGDDLAVGRLDAEYSVDAHGRRSFTRFKPADGTTPDEDRNPHEEE